MQGNFEKKIQSGLEFHLLQAQFEVLKRINEKWDWECGQYMSRKALDDLFSQGMRLVENMTACRNAGEETLPLPGFINDLCKMIIYLQTFLASIASGETKSIDLLYQAIANLQHYKNRLVYEHDETFYRVLYQISVNIRGVEQKAEHVALLWEYFNKYEVLVELAKWPLLSVRFDGYLFSSIAVSRTEDCTPEFISTIFNATLLFQGKLMKLAATTPAEQAARAFFLAANCESQIIMYQHQHRQALEAGDPEALKNYVLASGKMLLWTLRQVYRLMENYRQIADTLFLQKIFRRTMSISCHALELMLASSKSKPSRELFEAVRGNCQFLLTILEFFNKNCAASPQKAQYLKRFRNKTGVLQAEILEINRTLEQQEKHQEFESLTKRLCDEGKYQQVFESIEKNFREITAAGWDAIAEGSPEVGARFGYLTQGQQILYNATVENPQPFHSELMKTSACNCLLGARIAHADGNTEVATGFLVKAVEILTQYKEEISFQAEPIFYDMLAELVKIERIDTAGYCIPSVMIHYACREPASANFSLNHTLTTIYIHAILLGLGIPDNPYRDDIRKMLEVFALFFSAVHRFPTRNFLERIQLASILSKYSAFCMNLRVFQTDGILENLGTDPILANPLDRMQKIYELLKVSREMQKKIKTSPKASKLWKESYKTLLSCAYLEFNIWLADEADAGSFFEKAVNDKKLLSDILSIGKNLFTDETKTSDYKNASELLETLSLKTGKKQDASAKSFMAAEDAKKEAEAARQKAQEDARKKAEADARNKKESEENKMTPNASALSRQGDRVNRGKALIEAQCIQMEKLLDLTLFQAGKFTEALEQYKACLILAEETENIYYQIKARSYMADILWIRFNAELMTLSSTLEGKIKSPRILREKELDFLKRSIEEVHQSAEYRELYAIYCFGLSAQWKPGYQESAHYLTLVEEIIIKINRTFFQIRKNMDQLNQKSADQNITPAKGSFSVPIPDRNAFPELKKNRKQVVTKTHAAANPIQPKKTGLKSPNQEHNPGAEADRFFSSPKAAMADAEKPLIPAAVMALPPELASIFEQLKTLSGILLMTGSTVSNFYQKKHFSNSDIDFVLVSDEANLVKNCKQLMSLTFVKNEALKTKDWTLWSTWLPNSKGHWVPVDIVLRNKTENWLSCFKAEQDFTTALALDAEGRFYDLSGQACKHLIEKKIQLVGIPSERLRLDPILLLRIMDRILVGNHLEETTEKALQDWEPTGDYTSRAGHINASLAKYLKKWNKEDFIKTMIYYGLPEKMFGISENNWEDILEKVRDRMTETCSDFLENQESVDEKNILNM